MVALGLHFARLLVGRVYGHNSRRSVKVSLPLMIMHCGAVLKRTGQERSKRQLRQALAARRGERTARRERRTLRLPVALRWGGRLRIDMVDEQHAHFHELGPEPLHVELEVR